VLPQHVRNLPLKRTRLFRTVSILTARVHESLHLEKAITPYRGIGDGLVFRQNVVCAPPGWTRKRLADAAVHDLFQLDYSVRFARLLLLP
jgi:hypothetical protein